MTIHCKLLLPLTIGLLPVAGCGGDEEQAGELTEVPSAGQPGPADASLSDMNRSGVSGEAQLIRGEGGIDVELRLEGAEPESKYIARIYQGQCGDGGPEVLSLGHIGVTETEALLTERIDPALLDPARDYYVEVRTPDHRPVACANLDLTPLNLNTPPTGAASARQEPERPFEQANEGGGQAASERAAASNP